MNRWRALFLLFPLILLLQAPQTVLAAPSAPTSTWNPGIYLGTITIKAKDHHSTPQDVKDRGGSNKVLSTSRKP
jgi:hypothetical protein